MSRVNDYYQELHQAAEQAQLEELDRQYWERLAQPKLSIDAEYRALSRFERFYMICMLLIELLIIGLILGGAR